MSEYDEMSAIPMDGSAIEFESTQLIPEGEYLFTIAQMKREQVEKSAKMPNHTNIRFMLKLEDADGARGTAWDNIRMYMKWAWKFAEVAKSIGHTPDDSNSVRINWDKFVGAEGRVKVTIRDWTKADGTVEKQNSFKYLLPGVSAADKEIPF